MGLVLRLLAAWTFVANHPRTYLFSHPYEMGLVADSLLHGLGYSSPFGGATGPTAIVAPGYPTLIAAIFFLFGSYTFASALAIVGLQIAIGLLTIWLILHVAGRCLGAPTAVLAAAFWAVSLPLLFIPTIFWETSLSACSIVAAIAIAVHCSRRSRTVDWVVLGAACSVASLINPALLPSLVAIMLWTAYRTRTLGRTAPVLGFVVLLAIFAPWPIRNAYRFHAFIPLRSTVGMEMYMGNRPGATGRLDDSLFPMFNKTELSSYRAKGEVAYTQGKSEQAWSYIRANPGVFVALSLRRIFRFWSGTGNVDGPLIYEWHALTTTLFGFAGLVFLYRNRMRAMAALMAIPLVLFPLPYYITHAEFRYRLNIDPLLTILAAYAVTQIVSKIAHRHPASVAVKRDATAVVA
jgi:hypothetical protein